MLCDFFFRVGVELPPKFFQIDSRFKFLSEVVEIGREEAVFSVDDPFVDRRRFRGIAERRSERRRLASNARRESPESPPLEKRRSADCASFESSPKSLRGAPTVRSRRVDSFANSPKTLSPPPTVRVKRPLAIKSKSFIRRRQSKGATVARGDRNGTSPKRRRVRCKDSDRSRSATRRGAAEKA